MSDHIGRILRCENLPSAMGARRFLQGSDRMKQPSITDPALLLLALHLWPVVASPWAPQPTLSSNPIVGEVLEPSE
jgi:hypothetical protein